MTTKELIERLDDIERQLTDTGRGKQLMRELIRELREEMQGDDYLQWQKEKPNGV